MLYTKNQILKVLKNVYDPDSKKDLITLNMIKDIIVTNNTIKFTLMLTTPVNPLKNYIINACHTAIKKYLSENIEININVESNTKNKNVTKINHNKIKNIILIASGKGGVGKSTVASNIAISLSLMGAKVGILDADIYGPSIPIIFDICNEQPKQEIIENKNLIIPIKKYGIKILSIGLFTSDNQAIPWRGPMVSSAIKQLLNDANWGNLDYMIVDMPPGTGDIHITVAQNFNAVGSIIITTPQILSISDTTRSIYMFKMEKINISILGIIENMSYFTPKELPNNKYFIFGKNGSDVISKKFNIPILGKLPIIMSEKNKIDLIINNKYLESFFKEISEKIIQKILLIK